MMTNEQKVDALSELLSNVIHSLEMWSNNAKMLLKTLINVFLNVYECF
jgi:hypothetical protein